MQDPPPEELFPTPEDTRVHRGAATKRKKEEIILSRKVADTSTPQELVNLVMEIIREKYRRGNRLIRFSVVIPVANFAPWAKEAGIISADMDEYDRTSIRQSLTRTARLAIPQQLKTGSIFRLECQQSASKLDFKIHLRVSDK